MTIFKLHLSEIKRSHLKRNNGLTKNLNLKNKWRVNFARNVQCEFEIKESLYLN